MKPSELETRILEAAIETLRKELDRIGALLAEKNAAIEKLGDAAKNAEAHEILAHARAEKLERSRDDWKRIAGKALDAISAFRRNAGRHAGQHVFEASAESATCGRCELSYIEEEELLDKSRESLQAAYDALLKGDSDAKSE